MSRHVFGDAYAPDFRERKLAAESGLTPRDMLIKLARDPDKRVRRAVAANQSAPMEALLGLMWQRDYDVRATVARNVVAPSEILVVVVRNPSTKVILRDKWAHEHELPIEPYWVFSGVRESARQRLKTIHANNSNAGEEFGWVPANEISPPESLGQWAAEHPTIALQTLIALAFGPCFRARWPTTLRRACLWLE